MSKIFSFDELDKDLTKNVDSLGSKMSENEFSRIDTWVSTGNYLLNAQIGGSIFKGIPGNRTTIYSGESGVGKSFLILNAVREAQKMGYYVIYGDSESAIDMNVMVNFGIDPERVRYQPLKTVLGVRHFVANLCKTLKEKKKAGFEVPKLMFIVDSLGNLATEKEINDSITGSDKRDMTKQQNMRSLFRVITTELAELKIIGLMSNHVYQSVGGYIPMTIQSGGGGSIYNASVILNLTKSNLKDGDTEAPEGQAKTGIIVTSRPAKNRFAKPIPIKFHISFYKGMNPYVGLEDYISWEVCGIGKGKLIEEIIDKPMFEDDGKTPKMRAGKHRIEKFKTGNMIYEPDTRGNNYAVKHLGKTVKGAGIFNSDVFTQEILEKLDEVIKPVFELPKNYMEEDELMDLLDLNDEEIIQIDDLDSSLDGPIIPIIREN